METDEVDLNRGLSEAQLEELIGARDYKTFLNTRNELYRERDMKNNPPPRGEAIRLMAAHPNLIKRPILVNGAKMALGFEAEQFAAVAAGR